MAALVVLSIVVELSIVNVPVPRAPALLIRSVPELKVTPPLKVFVPDKLRVPEPVLMIPPVEPIAWLITNVSPVATSIALELLVVVTGWFAPSVNPFVMARVPPARIKEPVGPPRAEFAAMLKVPSERTTPRAKVLLPSKVKVPFPFF